MNTLLSYVEPVVLVTNVANSLFDTALLMVVYDRLNGTTPGNSDLAQKEVAQFYMIYNMIYSLLPMLTTVLLGRWADCQGQKVLLVVPLLGYLLGRVLLLFTHIFHWPVSVMYGSAVINGLTGGFPAYWSGINAIAALRSGVVRRSLRLNVLEVTSGAAGLLGSVVSGHFFLIKVNNQHGLLLICLCLSLYLLSLLYSAIFLRYPAVLSQGQVTVGTCNPCQRKFSREMILLFICYILYDFGVTGGENIISIYVLKPPLSWDPIFVGYGKAATFAMFLTSFLGVLILSGHLSDSSLVLMGIISNTAGFATMAFVRSTPLYFIARAMMLFSCIPLPTIRGSDVQRADEASYGSIFAWLQTAMTLADVISTLTFNSLYVAFLEWYSGFSLLLAAAVCWLSTLPVVIYSYRLSKGDGSQGSDTDSTQRMVIDDFLR
ncbi:thymic stromal cotransporter homolog [Pristis pectinata]|uniref:thymic stromal cotransporter homolog n=1 Tax=Pristis pectinata TaxID=685728 RepID=UPI00223E1967|nr:thymic stromal cotransporter homolog [Pristis pectinata]